MKKCVCKEQRCLASTIDDPPQAYNVNKKRHYMVFYDIMLFMVNINDRGVRILNQLGKRLMQARLARNESQEVFAARIGLTRQTYSKMEKGAATVPLGYWLAASDILGRLQTWQDVLLEKEDLFEQFERNQSKRKRARGQRAKQK
jgi:DNA-binding XRE family transcriptional regulator